MLSLQQALQTTGLWAVREGGIRHKKWGVDRKGKTEIWENSAGGGGEDRAGWQKMDQKGNCFQLGSSGKSPWTLVIPEKERILAKFRDSGSALCFWLQDDSLNAYISKQYLVLILETRKHLL